MIFVTLISRHADSFRTATLLAYSLLSYKKSNQLGRLPLIRYNNEGRI